MKQDFIKEDLKLGVSIVKLYDGKVGLCTKNALIDKNGNSIMHINNLNFGLDNLFTYSVVEAYEIKYDSHAKNLSSLLELDSYDVVLVWKREKPKEMTISQIEEKLGYKIKIVEDKK